MNAVYISHRMSEKNIYKNETKLSGEKKCLDIGRKLIECMRDEASDQNRCYKIYEKFRECDNARRGLFINKAKNN